MTKTAVLYRMVMPNHLCPFGLRSLDLLKREGYEVEDHHLTSREETDAFREKHDVKTTPQTFIDGKRIGGYDDLRAYFGKEAKQAKGGTSYQPVIAVFATTFLMALASSWSIFGDLFTIRMVELFIAYSMCVLAIMKLRDLESFTNQFLGYDLLAQRVVRYAYVYPFAEAFAAIGMLSGVLPLPVALVALFIGTMGAVSVIKAVHVDRRELRCACVGGNSNVPLGFVSLTENLMMVAMGLWLLGGIVLH